MKNNVSNTYKNPDVTTLFVNALRVFRRYKFREFMEELSIVKPTVFDKLIKNDVRKWSCAYNLV